MKALFFALLTVIFWGSAPIFEKLGLVRVSPVVGLAVRSFVATSVMLVVLFSTGHVRELAEIKLSTFLYIAVGAIFAGLLGQFFYFSALKHGATSFVVPLVGAYPLVTTILGVTLLREGITWPKALGIALIVSGVALLGWTRR